MALQLDHPRIFAMIFVPGKGTPRILGGRSRERLATLAGDRDRGRDQFGVSQGGVACLSVSQEAKLSAVQMRPHVRFRTGAVQRRASGAREGGRGWSDVCRMEGSTVPPPRAVPRQHEVREWRTAR